MALSIQFVIILFIFLLVMLISSELTLWKIVIGVLLFIPSSIQGLISGVSYDTPGVLNLSMMGYVSIITCCIIIGKHRFLSRKQTLGIIGSLTIIIAVRIITDGADFLSNKLFDNYLIPMILAISILSSLKVEYIPKLLKFIYKCIFIGAIIACIEHFYGQSIFFHNYYIKNFPWYVNIYESAMYVGFRSCSFYGHPLIGGIYYSMGIIYLLNMSNKNKHIFSWFLQLIILFAAILSTNSRSALLVVGIYLAYYLFKNKKVGIIFTTSAIVLILILCFDWNIIYNTFFARDSSGSSIMVRIQALTSFFNLPIKNLMFGVGYNNTADLLKMYGFIGNMEIAYLIIWLENGIIGFIAWIFSIFILYGRKMVKNEIGNLNVCDMIKGMLFFVLIIGGMSNAFGDPGTLNYMIYILLGFSSALTNSQYSLNELNSLTRKTSRRKILFNLGR